MRTTRRAARLEPKKFWWQADEGEVHKTVFPYVEAVESQQFDTFNRFVCLEALYDPNAPNLPTVIDDEDETIGLVIENVIASNVDTVTAAIAATEVRARFMTDDGDWSVQQTAMRLEYYVEGLGKKLKIAPKCEMAFKEAAKKGTGLVKVYVNGFDEVCVDHVRIDDIIVDDAECRNGGTPRQLHQRWVNAGREELKAQFPEYEDEIDRAQTSRGWSNMWAGYRPVVDDALVVIESWKLPIGRQGHKGYRPGRHTITIDGCDLLDEEWHKDHFPFPCMVWSKRSTGFYGISLAERIAGIQRALNKRNWQIDRNLDQYAIPTTYVDMADANLAVQSINRIGTVVVHKGERPTTVTPQAVSPEVYQNRVDMKNAAREDSGVNPMMQHGTKPTGIDSGIGMREVRDQASQRFSMQEKEFERFVLDVFLQVVGCCKELGDAAPVVTRKAKFEAKKIRWADVDMGDIEVQIAASSPLGRTPAGRYQMALEWAQAGVISTDEWRQIVKHPDLDHVLSLYTQGWESVQTDIEAIIDGHVVMPEPFGNLLLMTRMGQMAYLKYRDLRAPEEILEAIRQYVVNAAYMFKQRASAANSNAAPGAAPAPGSGGEMPVIPEAPPASTPASALAPMLAAG